VNTRVFFTLIKTQHGRAWCSWFSFFTFPHAYISLHCRKGKERNTREPQAYNMMKEVLCCLCFNWMQWNRAKRSGSAIQLNTTQHTTFRSFFHLFTYHYNWLRDTWWVLIKWNTSERTNEMKWKSAWFYLIQTKPRYERNHALEIKVKWLILFISFVLFQWSEDNEWSEKRTNWTHFTLFSTYFLCL